MTIKLYCNRFDLVTYEDGHHEKGAIVEVRAVRLNRPDLKDAEPDAVIFCFESQLKEFYTILHKRYGMPTLIHPGKAN